MNKIHLCETYKYCTHSPNLIQPYYWCSWYGKEVRIPIERCNEITLKTNQKGIKMKTFEVTLTIEASDCTTVEDICKSLEENSSLIEFDLSEGNITDINVSELEFE